MVFRFGLRRQNGGGRVVGKADTEQRIAKSRLEDKASAGLGAEEGGERRGNQ